MLRLFDLLNQRPEAVVSQSNLATRVSLVALKRRLETLLLIDDAKKKQKHESGRFS